MKVLLADDSATVRMILKGLLKQLAITDVVEAPDGKAALAVLAADTIDLLLLDIHMPVMDGIECLTALKANPATAQLPVVIISSDTSPEQVEQVMNLGANAHIGKPFRIAGLVQALSGPFPWLELPATEHKNA